MFKRIQIVHFFSKGLKTAKLKDILTLNYYRYRIYYSSSCTDLDTHKFITKLLLLTSCLLIFESVRQSLKLDAVNAIFTGGLWSDVVMSVKYHIIMLLDSCCLWSAIANTYLVIDAYSQMFLIVTGGLRSDVANDHIIAFGGMLLITT